MKAIITLEDTGDGGFTLRCVQEGGFSKDSPAHVASYVVIEQMGLLAQQKGQPVVNTTDVVVAVPMAERIARQQWVVQLYAWLGRWKDELPLQAVLDVQDLLGPLPSTAINVDKIIRPTPEQIAGN